MPIHISSKIGERMISYAIDAARAHGCRIMQLTTDKPRPDAQRFYERLGFTSTHEGMKLTFVRRGDGFLRQ